ncbi:coronin-2B-like isoform X2 [Chrysoperla carnea]|uniref:coronin-2B-like isoform X2 n=1 Tax=Chrysoperla carnea TaxID=189513 RepID=UPI001D0886A1|nr:coronin-2B-like isoform X2 [Chrysoperla carnea]
MTNSQIWFRGVRSSKFRHVYGVPAKRERCYDNIKITKNAHDSQFCAVNPKFLAVVTEVAGGGAFLVVPIDHTGRIDFNASRVTGHRGPVLDIKWNPFNDNIIASCSDDCTIKLWHIPDGGLSMHLQEWMVELQGHKRRVAYIEWHPTAENILFSAGFDHLLIVWNIGRGEAVNVIDCHTDVIYCMSLNRDGSFLATTCKDKKLRVIEPRTGMIISEGVCHQGTKASKVTFLGDTGRLLTTGFSRHSDRQYAVWNQHDLSKPLTVETIDSSSGVVFPFYDYDTNVIYLAGKGDGNIRYYEVVNDPPYIHFLSQFLSGNPQRGLGIMPKRGCNTSQCEVFRFYKLHTTRNMCEPISMVVPRKSDQFQEDLYPDTVAARPALTADEWISGRNAQPILMSLKTGGNITTHIPRVFKSTPIQHVLSSENNNQKKFAFLSCETIPDYRPKDMNAARIIHNEKSQKTSTNQTTKFHQLQQMFGNRANNIENNMDCENGDVIIEPLYKQIGSNSTSTQFDNESDLQKAYNRQCEEIRLLKKQLANSDVKIHELEEQIKRLQK